MLIFMHHMGTWQHKSVFPTLPGSSSSTVVLSKQNNIVEYRNGEKQYNLLIACRKAGLGNPRSQ
jgi:hypothetical protein